MPTRIGLVTKPGKPFNQFGHACVPDQEIPEEVYTSWMKQDPAVVNNRLAGGWVEWRPIEYGEDATKGTGPTIDTMDKDALTAFAKKELAIDLDQRTSLKNLRLQVHGMMERAALIKSAQAKTGAQRAIAEENARTGLTGGGAEGGAGAGEDEKDPKDTKDPQ